MSGERPPVLAVVSLSSFLTPFMGSAVTVALPVLSAEFRAGAGEQIWVMMAFQAATAVVLLPAGRIADLFGRARVFRAGLAGFAVASVGAALAPAWGALLAARALQGGFGAMIFCTGPALILEEYPASGRGRALGYAVAAVYLGLSLGPVLGGVLTEAAGWRSLFWFSGALGAASWALALWELPPDPPARGPRGFDVGGAFLYGGSILALAASFSALPHEGGRLAGAALLAAGVAGLGAFLRLEARTEQPLLDLGLFRGNPAFTFSNLAALIHYSASAAVAVLVSLYLQHLKRMPADRAGLVLLVQPALMAALSPLAGRLSDRLQPRLVASLGMAGTTLALAALFFLSPDTPLPLLVADLALLGIGFAFFSSPNTNAVMSSAPPARYAVASAVLSTMRLAGHVASMGLVMLVFAWHMGREPLAEPLYPQFHASLRTAFPILAGLGGLGILASLARGEVRRGTPPADPACMNKGTGSGEKREENG